MSKNGSSKVKKSKADAVEAGEVLDLSEVALYLRLDEDAVVELVDSQQLPGRQVRGEWRFLKTAVKDWLSTPVARSRKEAQLAVVGSWKDDPFIKEELKEIYANRGRPEDGELPW